MTALPTRRDEAWRYADLEAVAALWPAAPAEAITLAPGEIREATLIAEDGIRDFAITLGAHARYDFHLLVMAERYGRVTIDVTLHEGAHFSLGAAMLGGADQTLEIVTTMRHIEPNASSNQVVRTVVGGRATGSYLGKVAVARGAQKTDASQSVKAVLLTRTATANAVPQLEIYADDVKCAHGCAVGELDANALFYLASRGIAPADAKALLLRGFIAGVFDDVGDAQERERIETAAAAALERML